MIIDEIFKGLAWEDWMLTIVHCIMFQGRMKYMVRYGRT